MISKKKKHSKTVVFPTLYTILKKSHHTHGKYNLNDKRET